MMNTSHSFSRILQLVVFVHVGLLCTPMAHADDIITFGRWKFTSVDNGSNLKVNYQRDDGTYHPVFVRSVPEANYYLGEGDKRHVTIADFAQCAVGQSEIDDDFGHGIQIDYVFTQPSNGDPVVLTEHVWCYDEQPYCLLQLTLSSTDGQLLRCNYLSPVNCSTAYVAFTKSSRNRMLKVPFDNDGFVRYDRFGMSTSMTSYEVAAFYEGDTRRGLVVGSIDHDHWKSAIKATMSDNCKFSKLSLYSGVANSDTHDVREHGYLQGEEIASARFMVGDFDDWRDGMETFAAACNIVQPRRNNWTEGRPVGWMTWNVMEAHNNYTDDSENFQYFIDVLQPGGFTNGIGPDIMSIDAWSNLSSSEEKKLVSQAEKGNMIVGCYGNPFCLWWDVNNTSCLEQTYYSSSLSNYKGKDVVLYANGKPLVYDGAYCLDPTHPAVKAQAAAWVKKQLTMGYRYLKLDFVSNGIMEADSYYNPDVHTGVEAYNEGFAYFMKQVDRSSKPIYVLLSIAPLFPYQYANARRQATDTWGTINWTEYAMNAITAGWWTGGLYQYNDPDGLPMVGHGDQGATTLAENRSRLTSGIVSGHVLLADNFSLTNQGGRGNPSLSRRRVNSLFTNPDINAMLALDPHFRPVYGYNEYEGKSSGAEAAVMMSTDEYHYVAIFNYNSDLNKANIKGTISLSDMGIAVEDCAVVRELWTGTDVDVKDGLKYDIPSRDCRVYRFTRSASLLSQPIADNGLTTFPTLTCDLSGRPANALSRGIVIEDGVKNYRK